MARAPSACLWPTWPDASRPPSPPTFCGAPADAAGRLTTVYCREHAAAAVRAWEDRTAAPLSPRYLRLTVWNKAATS